MHPVADRRVCWRRVVLLAVVTLVAASGALGAPGDDLRLVEAVKNRDLATVRALLAEQVGVNTALADGATALQWAAYWDDLDTADRLIRADAEVNAANEYGVTPLSLACTNRNAALVERLLTAGADPNAALVETGETVLMACARAGSLAAVTALLTRGADVHARESSGGQTALMWAVSRRHPEVTQVLIEHGADVHARSRVTPWVISRRLQGNLQFNERLRIYGTDAKETKKGGFTPLLFAARQGALESAAVLLAAGADPNDAAANGMSALVLAAHSGHGALAGMLLEQGADPNHAGSGYTGLHAAVLTGDVELVKVLLAKGADPNVPVWQATPVSRNGQVLMLAGYLLGATPFGLAAKYVDLDILRVLAATDGVDPALALDTGETPLMLAAGAGWRQGRWDRRDRAALFPQVFRDAQNESGTLEAVRLVMELGADVHAVDENGDTVLHHVVGTGFDSVVEFLVSAGAKLDATNTRGLTPLASLSRRGPAQRPLDPERQATADLLRSLGAQEQE